LNSPIAYEQQDGVGLLTLDRPDKLNAMTHEMGDAIRAQVQRLNADPQLRCVLVRGAGRAFSAGGDIDFLEKNLAQEARLNQVEMMDFYTKFLAIRELDVPTIALIHGRATGAGLCFALGCAMRFAADDALLSVNFVRIGLTPGMGATWNLARLVGEARAAELLYTGRAVSGLEAAAIGLVNGACAPDRLMDLGHSVARDIASAAPTAVRETKKLARLAASLALADALDAEAAAQARCFAGTELREGLAAIKERREPSFGAYQA
jgi:enoyl-CoA hydratase/carnithine racemase